MTEQWIDPFSADDPAAREREARRREREARRRAQLGQRVSEAEGERTPEPEPPTAGPAPAQPPRAQEPEPVASGSRSAAPTAANPEPRPEPAPPPLAARRAPALPGGRSRAAVRRRRIALGIVLVFLALIVAFLVLLFQPFHGAGHGKVIVRIPKGASASQIADMLDRKGVVANSTLFRIRLDLSGDSGDIQAGTYTLAAGMSYGGAIDALTTPPKQRTVTVTIPEGYDRRQSAKLARRDGLRGNYMKATAKAHGFDLARYSAPRSANLEGFLFPATYVLHPGNSVKKLVAQQLGAFAQRMRHLDLRYAKSKNLTPYDVLKIASIVQREAGDVRDFPDVAAVIYNRLRDDMPLQVDATIRFAESNYTRPLTQSDLHLNSPYNTYENPGLPPGPISNPGLTALKAAAHPPKVPYLYYVTKPGACGRLSFAATYSKFQQLQAHYNNARAAAGGKSPTTC
jgi:UPF0755 protein